MSESQADNNNFKSKRQYIYIIFFFLLGLCNNLGYVLVWVSSAEMSNALNQPNLVALYLLCLQIIGFLTRVAHMNYCIKISYKIKIYLFCIFNFVGYISFYLILLFTDHKSPESLKRSFFLSLITTIFLGISCNLGEVACIGYLKKYPSKWLSGYSGGTGMAGVLGALIKIIFVYLETSSSSMWLITSSSSLVYFISYISAEKMYYYDQKLIEKKKDSNSRAESMVNTNMKKNENLDDKTNNLNFDSEKNNYKDNLLPQKLSVDESNVINKNKDDIENKEEIFEDIEDDKASVKDIILESNNELIQLQSTENTLNEPFNCSNLLVVIKQAGIYILNLGIAYFMSYNIVHFAERYEAFKYIDNKNQYIFFNLMYQIGVLISRSSIQIISKLSSRSISYMIIAQSLLAVFWWACAQYGVLYNFIALLAIMLVVGLIEGSAYVFGFYLIYEDKGIEKKYRELSLNVCFNFCDSCLILSSLFALLADNTFLYVGQ